MWKVLLLPAVLSDITPPDYHLLRSMIHNLCEQKFSSYEESKNWVDSWIASKDADFFRCGIRMLPKRWEKVVAMDNTLNKKHYSFFTIKSLFLQKQRQLIFPKYSNINLIIIAKEYTIALKRDRSTYESNTNILVCIKTITEVVTAVMHRIVI